MTSLVRHMLGMAILLVLTTASFAADKAIIVLDASGSMWGQINGKPKLMIAREALHTVLQTLPPDLELGLMAYGHSEKGSCEDIELVVPPAAGTASAITTAADNMKFLGKTPLTAAVKQAAEALKYTEDKATVILITDGLETCNADPRRGDRHRLHLAFLFRAELPPAIRPPAERGAKDDVLTSCRRIAIS